MKKTTHTYTCDECGCRIFKEPMLKEINIITHESEYNQKDFCSLNCFLKYFNTLMFDEKIDVRIAQGDDD